MGPSVCLQCVFTIRTIGTIIAFELFITGNRSVPFHVHLPITLRGEAVRTGGAWEFPDELHLTPCEDHANRKTKSLESQLSTSLMGNEDLDMSTKVLAKYLKKQK